MLCIILVNKVASDTTHRERIPTKFLTCEAWKSSSLLGMECAKALSSIARWMAKMCSTDSGEEMELWWVWLEEAVRGLASNAKYELVLLVLAA